ncbi:MAG: asparagine synthetase B [Actinomycetia bacterium]|nr:asparagine synthetase B [Actinomycetes bacterium]
MDDTQSDHLKAYGLVYYTLKNDKGKWLLNYRSGSFLIEDRDEYRLKASLMGVYNEKISSSDFAQIEKTISENNMHLVELEKAPKIAIYAPSANEPWDDAVNMALEYAEIKYDKIWDPEVFNGKLEKYDWIHLHHEDFTGQFGKFYGYYRNAEWYKIRVKEFEKAAFEAGFSSVGEHKRAVAKMFKLYIIKGGFLFAMCSATDTMDIALASDGLDIIPQEIDGTPVTPSAQEKLNYKNCLAFTDFKLYFDPFKYEFSDIDIDIRREGIDRIPDTFTLFEFSAKVDPVLSMLTQNHTFIIPGFLGQTTAYYRKTVKDSIIIMGETPGTDRVRYIHGEIGEGTFTFFAGHDPEDYRHLVGDPPTKLSLHKHSPGYRLILNNILFPAARKEKRKT